MGAVKGWNVISKIIASEREMRSLCVCVQFFEAIMPLAVIQSMHGALTFKMIVLLIQFEKKI